MGAGASAAALVVAVALLSAIGTASQASVQHERILRFGVKFSPHNVSDVPPLAKHEGAYHAGDYATLGDVLTNSNGRPVGTEAGSGLITGVSHVGAQIFFSMAIHLHHGDITAAGIGSTAPNKDLVVTGGTGSFLGARGDVHVIENGDGTGSLGSPSDSTTNQTGSRTMARALVIEDESGTCSGFMHPHNGYYAGDFHRADVEPLPAQLVARFPEQAGTGATVLQIVTSLPRVDGHIPRAA